MEQGALVAIALFLAGQTIAFIWWAATITQGQKDHGERIQKVESVASKTVLEVAYMRGQKGLEL